MAFLDAYTLSSDPGFRGRIQIAIATIATYVVGEQSSGNPVKDKKRRDLGFGILNSPSSYIERFAIAVVTNPSITADSTDANIMDTVSSVFDDMAGV
jgi:hypothetical protein